MKQYKSWDHWAELKPRLSEAIEAGVALTTLAFYHDVSPRRMAEILDDLGLPRPEHYSPPEPRSEPFTEEYAAGNPHDIEHEVTAKPTSYLDHDGNGRAFSPGSLNPDPSNR